MPQLVSDRARIVFDSRTLPAPRPQPPSYFSSPLREAQRVASIWAHAPSLHMSLPSVHLPPYWCCTCWGPRRSKSSEVCWNGVSLFVPCWSPKCPSCPRTDIRLQAWWKCLGHRCCRAEGSRKTKKFPTVR